MKNSLKIRTSKIIVLILFISCNTFAQEVQKVINYTRGTWHTGLTLSINNTKDDNIENIFFDVIDNENDGFEMNLLGGYFIENNMSIGLQYSYLSRERDLIYTTENNESQYQFAKKKHSFIVFLRNYFPISSNNRFSFFNETDLGIGFSNSNVRHTKSIDNITKSFTDELDLKIGVKPGIAVILTKGFAFEVAVDLLGLTYTSSDITKDGLVEGSKSNFKFDFDISLLSLDFGLAYYF